LLLLSYLDSSTTEQNQNIYIIARSVHVSEFYLLCYHLPFNLEIGSGKQVEA